MSPAPNECKPMRQVDFYRERTTMCNVDPVITAGALGGMLRGLYRDDFDATEQQIDTSAAHLRRVLRRAELLLLTEPLLSNAENAVADMAPQQLAALPPLPDNTVFGFAQPRYFEMQGGDPHTLSVVVPINSAQLPFDDDDEPEPAYVGFGRLADFEYIYRQLPNAVKVHHTINDLRRYRQLWVPTITGAMRHSMLEEQPNSTMRHILAAAIERGSRPVNTTPPKAAQHEAKAARVHPKSARTVRTVELAPRYRDSSSQTGTGTGQPLRWRSTTKGHPRVYKNEDGTVRKEIWIDGYTRAKDRPPRPPEQTPGKVTVAREPKPPENQHGR